VIESLGAHLMIVVDLEDSALQRLGGKQPLAGYVGMPSIYVPYPCGEQILRGLDNGLGVTVTLTPSSDTVGSTNWINLAFASWQEEEDERLSQYEGLVQKYISSNDIVAWLRRRVDEIRSRKFKSITTDEL